jgi:hypothetical protein
VEKAGSGPLLFYDIGLSEGEIREKSSKADGCQCGVNAYGQFDDDEISRLKLRTFYGFC